MSLRTRRWNDPGQRDDGLRILVCRYRPRGLPKGKETWDEWRKELGPSPELLAAFHGKRGAQPLPWPEYRKRYLAEMRARTSEIDQLARRVAAGETITLLCSSACTDPERCHRTLLKTLIDARVPETNRSSSDSAGSGPEGVQRIRDTHVKGGRMALWFFQRTAPGDLRRIPLPSMQRFLAGERGLPHDGDGYVRCIGMAVELRNRKPCAVRRVWFSKIRVGGDGRVDPEHRPRVMREAGTHRNGHGSVVQAAHRFAERRLAHLAEWRPEESDLQALRSAVNGRAGKEMI
jgi:uncharacterized protein YeaO (DUF488 family)